MKKDSFVMVDTEQAIWTEAVMLNETPMVLADDAVVIDDAYEDGDFITLNEETQVLAHTDIWDMSSVDWNQGNGGEVIMIL